MNDIYFNQAVFVQKHSETISIIEEKFIELHRELVANSLFQWTSMELYLEAIDLFGYWHSKDYSRKLIDDTVEWIAQCEAVCKSPDFIALEERLPVMAKLVMEAREKIRQNEQS